MTRASTASALLLLLCVALPARGALPPGYGGELVLPAPSPLGVPDPTRADGPFEEAVNAAVFDTLYRVSPDGRVHPQLAARLPVREPGRFRIHLRRGVRRHDGRPLRASDVLASLQRAATSPEAGWLLEGVARRGSALDARANDADGTLEVRPVRADVPLARMLAARPLAIAASRDARSAVGTGPFSAELDGGRLRLRAFRYAPEGAPYLESITFEPPASRDDELRRFELGRLDGSWIGESLYGGRPVRPVRQVAGPGRAPVLLVRNPRGALSADVAWGALAGAVDRERLERVGLSASDRLQRALPAAEVPGGRRPATRVTLRMPVVEGDGFSIRLAEALAGIADEAGFAIVVTPLSRQGHGAALAAGDWDLRTVTVSPPLPGRPALVTAALVAAGQADDARDFLRGWRFDTATTAAAALRLRALVLGHRRERLFHRSDLLGLGFDRNGNLRLRDLHFARPSIEEAP